MNKIVPFDNTVWRANPRAPRRPELAKQKSFVHQAALWLVWITVASSAIVFTEPSPADVLSVGLIVLLPAIGLVRFTPGLGTPLCLLLTLCATGIFATTFATDLIGSLKHNAITIYLCATAILFAAFVAYKPNRHTRLILNAYMVTAVIAALCGIVGVFGLFPGAEELFTKFGRASGTFKDPNVFGPFLIPALVYAIHLILTRHTKIALPAFFALSILATALLLSLSRGAWFGASLAIGLYLYIFFVSARRDIDRLKVAGIGLFGMIGVVAIIGLIAQSPELGTLLSDRAALTQSYDVGTEGRFGGQAKALEFIQKNPIGIGALEFTAAGHHHENAHNTYLTFFLSNGWLGGFSFIILTLVTLALGFRHVLTRASVHPLFAVVFVSLVALFTQAMLIDIDHWRQLFLLLGIVWGMMTSNVNEVPERSSRIISDQRPLLLQPTIAVGPMRRPNRIVRRLPKRIDLPAAQSTQPSQRQHGHIIARRSSNDAGNALVHKYREQNKDQSAQILPLRRPDTH